MLRLKWIFLFVALCSLTAANAFAEVNGTLRVVKGDVKIISGKDGSTNPAKIGQKVFPKDTIVTGKDSRAKVIMVDNNELNVSPESKLQISDYQFEPAKDNKKVLLDVIYGKVRAKVNQKYDGDCDPAKEKCSEKGARNTFNIKTPSAVAGVRGTDFMTSYSTETRQTQVVTFEGRVAVGQPGINGGITNTVYVNPGQMTMAKPGENPSAPVKMAPQDLARMDRGSDADKAPADSQPAPGPDSRTPADDKKDDKKDQPKNDDQAGAQPKDRQGEGKPDEANKGPAANAGGPNKAEGDSGAKGPAANGPAAGGPGGTRAPASTGPVGSPGQIAGPGTPAPGGPNMGGPAMGPAMGGPGGMLRPEDMAGHAGADIPIIPGNYIPPIPAAQMPNMNNLPVCQFCNDAVQSGNSRLTIKINQANP